MAIRLPEAGPYTAVIVDDHLDLRHLLKLRLSMVPGLEVVGMAADGSDAIDLAQNLQPDVMTLDLEMPIMGGADAIPFLRAAAPRMSIVVFSADPTGGDLIGGSRPDAFVTKGSSLADLVAIVQRLLEEGPSDLVDVDVGRLPVEVALDAFDSWIGLNARVRRALVSEGDHTSDLEVEPADLSCLMGVFMQLGGCLAGAAEGQSNMNLKFQVRREAGVAARRALLALGGNGTLRAFNRAWSHRPSHESEQALDLVDSRLVEALPPS